jgi:signal peptidase I
MRKVTKVVVFTLAALLMLAAVTVNAAPYLGLVIGDIGSGSMEPTLGIGSMVIAHRVAPSELKVGDIIVFQFKGAGNNDICHRIAGILPTSPPSFVTQGDNSLRPDDIITPAGNVVGRVVYYLPGAGYFVQFLKTGAGLALCLVLPSLLIIIICLRALRHEFRNLKKSARISAAAHESNKLRLGSME